MENCIFCRIAKGDIPAAKVYEDGKIMAFLDIAPAAKGHCLIMPKEHYETMLDMPEALLEDMIRMARKIARAMSSSLGNKGFNVLMNNKKEAEQLIPHAHLHVIPRNKGDGIRLNWRQQRYGEGEIGEFKGKIVKFL